MGATLGRCMGATLRILRIVHGCHPSQSLNLMHIMGATHTK